MALTLGRVKRIRTPGGIRCLKKFASGKVRFVSCRVVRMKGLNESGIGRKRRKKSKSRKTRRR